MAKKKLKLKQIRCYQSVPIGLKKVERTTFSVIDIPGREKITLEFASINENTVVRITSADDCVDVPFSNISSIQYFNSRDAELEEQKQTNADAMAANVANAKDTAARPV